MANKVKTSYQKVKVAEDNKKKAKASYGLRQSKSSLSPLTVHLLENEGSEKTDTELIEEFRDECSHSFVVIASKTTETGKHIVYSCKHCFVTEATQGHRKPGLKKKEADGKEDSD